MPDDIMAPKDSGYRERPIHVIESEQFRSVQVNGASTGSNRFGNVSVAFWTERPVMPMKLEYRRYANGEQEVLGFGSADALGFTRELEVNILMTPETALGLAEQLIAIAKHFGASLPAPSDPEGGAE